MNRVKILVVEDELMIAAHLCMILEEQGYEPIDANGSREQAIQILESDKPDLAILDINLFNKPDGIEIGAQIKKKYQIPFIFLTSNSDKETIQSAKQVNPAAYLIKPFHQNDIFAAIEIALANASNSTSIKEEDPADETIVPLFNNYIFIKHNNRYIKTSIKDIAYIQSGDKYVEVFIKDGSHYLLRSTLESIIDKFTNYHFIRVHKSYAINPIHLEQVSANTLIVNKTELPIGRAYKENLTKWIDTLT